MGNMTQEGKAIVQAARGEIRAKAKLDKAIKAGKFSDVIDAANELMVKNGQYITARDDNGDHRPDYQAYKRVKDRFEYHNPDYKLNRNEDANIISFAITEAPVDDDGELDEGNGGENVDTSPVDTARQKIDAALKMIEAALPDLPEDEQVEIVNSVSHLIERFQKAA